MAGRRLLGAAIVTAAAILTLSVASTAALAAAPDRTPPSAPRIIYVQGYHCLTLIVGVDRSTDNRSAPSTGPSTTNVVPGYPC